MLVDARGDLHRVGCGIWSLRLDGVKLLDFLITFIEIGEELDCSVSFSDYVAVNVEDCSVFLCLIPSFLDGDAGLFLKEGVFFIVSDLSLRDLDVVALL